MVNYGGSARLYGAFRNNRSGAMGEIPDGNNSNGEIRPPLPRIHAVPTTQMYFNKVRTQNFDVASDIVSELTLI